MSDVGNGDNQGSLLFQRDVAQRQEQSKWIFHMLKDVEEGNGRDISLPKLD